MVSSLKKNTMEYFRKLEEFIVSEELWPAFRNPESIAELERVAAEVYSKGSLEGSLSSILIYQQIAEEMVWVLLKDCQSMIKICLMGQAEIIFSDQHKAMFGRLIDELKNTINFENKIEFIRECNALNSIRISVVHGLSKNTELAEIRTMAEQAKKHFESIRALYTESHKYFCDYFEHEKTNIICEYQANAMGD